MGKFLIKKKIQIKATVVLFTKFTQLHCTLLEGSSAHISFLMFPAGA